MVGDDDDEVQDDPAEDWEFIYQQLRAEAAACSLLAEDEDDGEDCVAQLLPPATVAKDSLWAAPADPAAPVALAPAVSEVPLMSVGDLALELRDMFPEVRIHVARVEDCTDTMEVPRSAVSAAKSLLSADAPEFSLPTASASRMRANAPEWPAPENRDHLRTNLSSRARKFIPQDGSCDDYCEFGYDQFQSFEPFQSYEYDESASMSTPLYWYDRTNTEDKEDAYLEEEEEAFVNPVCYLYSRDAAYEGDMAAVMQEQLTWSS